MAGVVESVRRNSKVGVIAGSSMIAVGVLAIAVQFFGTRTSARFRGADAFFSIDEGKTFFVDSASQIPPFEHGGQQAVRAYVYSYGNGKQYVAYLERYTPAGRAIMQQIEQQSQSRAPDGRLVARSATEREVKRPGEANWHNAEKDQAYAHALLDPRAPDGSIPDLVQP